MKKKNVWENHVIDPPIKYTKKLGTDTTLQQKERTRLWGERRPAEFHNLEIKRVHSLIDFSPLISLKNKKGIRQEQKKRAIHRIQKEWQRNCRENRKNRQVLFSAGLNRSFLDSRSGLVLLKITKPLVLQTGLIHLVIKGQKSFLSLWMSAFYTGTWAFAPYAYKDGCVCTCIIMRQVSSERNWSI